MAISCENKDTLREHECEGEHQVPKDRWLAETLYRNAAKLGLLTWKENRRDYQNLYTEVIGLENYRQERTKQVLLNCLARRRRLVGSAHGALMPGAMTLKAGMKSKKSVDNELEKELEKLLPPGKVHHPSTDLVGSKKGDDAVDFQDDAFESSYVMDRRVFSLKVGSEWKPAVSVRTLDHYLHFFVAGNGIKNESGTSAGPIGEPFTIHDVTRSITSPRPEFSVAPADEFDVKIRKETVELLRTGRSKVFRKREDHIQIKFASERGASQFVEHLRRAGDDYGASV